MLGQAYVPYHSVPPACMALLLYFVTLYTSHTAAVQHTAAGKRSVLSGKGILGHSEFQPILHTISPDNYTQATMAEQQGQTEPGVQMERTQSLVRGKSRFRAVTYVIAAIKRFQSEWHLSRTFGRQARCLMCPRHPVAPGTSTPDPAPCPGDLCRCYQPYL